MKKTPIVLLSTLFVISCGPTPVSSLTSSSSQSSYTESSSSTTSSSSSENSSTSSSTSSSSSISSSTSSSQTSTSSSSSSSSTSSSSSSELPPISYVQVFCPVRYNYIYAWQNTSSGVKELVGSWPGTPLKSYDSEWKTYDFPGETSLNLIFNLGQGQEQTADLSVSEAGY